MIYHSGAMSIESPFPFENVHGVRNLYIQDNSKQVRLYKCLSRRMATRWSIEAS